MKRIIHSYTLGDMCATYVEETQNGICGMMLYPAALADRVSLEGSWQVDSLVQVKLVGDAYPTGFSCGHTMRNSQTAIRCAVHPVWGGRFHAGAGIFSVGGGGGCALSRHDGSAAVP